MVMILSEESARDDLHSSIQNCLPSRLMELANFESIFCPQITELRIKKVLEGIASQERLFKSQALSSSIDDVSSTCMGDLRHAILRFQFLVGCNKGGRKTSRSNVQKSTRRKGQSEKEEEKDKEVEEVEVKVQGKFFRDSSFSSLHSVSKLLSAKLDSTGRSSFPSFQSFIFLFFSFL